MSSKILQQIKKSKDISLFANEIIDIFYIFKPRKKSTCA